MAVPPRILTAVPLCDGHDSAILTVNEELVRDGFEVVYLGYHRSAKDVARAAVQEGALAVGISSYNGGHVEFFSEVVQWLRKYGARSVRVFGGGGGTISESDARRMRRRGVARIFFAGTPFTEIVRGVRALCGRRSRGAADALRGLVTPPGRPRSRVIGFAGPGGSGKSTLIDELVLRILSEDSQATVAILSHDPSRRGKGALLGDRAAMIHAQNDRVFMRSLATGGAQGGLCARTREWIQRLRRRGFNLILVESAGIGQEASPFSRAVFDESVFVLTADYGSRLQLQKIVMFDTAGIVVVNKADRPGAQTALAEVQERMGEGGKLAQNLFATAAVRHRDPGVDALLARLARPQRRNDGSAG